MATTVTMSGSLTVSGSLNATLSGDKTGGEVDKLYEANTYAAAGGSAPTVDGWTSGSISIAIATDYLVAAATAAFGSHSEGLVPSTKKIKALYIKNTSAAGAGNLAVARGAAAGLTVFDAAGDSITLPPGGSILIQFETGTAAITTGASDKLSLSPSAGTVTADIKIWWGS